MLRQSLYRHGLAQIQLLLCHSSAGGDTGKKLSLRQLASEQARESLPGV